MTPDELRAFGFDPDTMTPDQLARARSVLGGGSAPAPVSAPAAAQPAPPRKGTVAPSTPAPATEPPPRAPVEASQEGTAFDVPRRQLVDFGQLAAAQEEEVQRRAVDPRGFIAPDDYATAQRQVAARVMQGRSAGGTRLPTQSRLQDMAQWVTGQLERSPEQRTGWQGVVASLAPQIVLTPEEAQQRRDLDSAAYGRAHEALLEVYGEDYRRRPGYEQELERAASAVRGGTDPRRAVLEQPLDLTGGPDVGRIAERAFTQEDPGGRITESPVAYVARLTQAPVSAAVGVAEGLLTDADVDTAVAKRLAGGEGIAGAGHDLGTWLAQAAGLTDEQQARAGQLGWWGGFVGDLVVPVDLGVGAAAGKAAGTAVKTARVAGELGTEVGAGGVAKAVARDFVQNNVIAKRLGVEPFDARVEAVKLATQDPRVKDAGTVVWKMLGSRNRQLTDDLVEQAAIAYREARVGTRYNDVPWKDFLTEADALGLPVRNLERFADEAGDYFYRAMLEEGLTEAQKARLLEGATLNTEELRHRLATYLTDARSVRGNLEAWLTAEEKLANHPQLRALMRESGDGRKVIGDRTVLDPTITPEGLPRFDVDDRVLRQFLADKIGRRLDTVLGLDEGLQRVTPSLWLPASEAHQVAAKVRTSPVAQLNAKAQVLQKGRIDLAPEDAAAIRDYFIDRFDPERLVREPGSPSFRRRYSVVFDRQFKTPVGQKLLDEVDNLSLSPAEYNDLVRAAYETEARAMPGARSLQDVQDVADRTGGALRLASIDRAFTPKELQASGLERTVTATLHRATGGGEAARSPVWQTIVRDVRAKFGSLFEEVKADVRRVRAAGAGRSDAYGQLLLDAYDGGMSDDVLLDFLVTAWGGYERTADVMQTTARNVVRDNLPSSPAQLRDLLSVLFYTDVFVEMRAGWEAARAKGGKAALDYLFDVHRQVAGVRLHQIAGEFKRGDPALVKALEQARADGRVSISMENTRAGRGVDELWKFTRELAPAFGVPAHGQLLATNLLQRRMHRAVDDVLTDAAERYPAMFPSPDSVRRLAEQDWSYRMQRLPLLDELIERNVRDAVDGVLDLPLTPHPDDDALARLIGRVQRVTTDVLRDDWQGIYRTGLESTLASLTNGRPTAALRDRVRKLLERIDEKLLAQGYDESTGKGARAAVVVKPDDAKVVRQAVERAVFEALLTKGDKPGSRYLRAIGHELRPDMVSDYWGTLLTEIRAGFKREASTRLEGPAERIMRTSLAYGDTKDVKASLLSSASVERMTETLEALHLQANERALDRVLGGSVGELADVAVPQAMKALEEIKGAPPPLRARFAKQVIELFKVENLSDNIAVLGNLAKSGVLGGNVLPNLKYMLTNYLTAPAIIWGQLGGKAAAGALLGSPDALRVVRRIYAPASLADVAGDRVVLTTADGRIYTEAMLAELVVRNSVSRSQAAAELTQNVLEDVVAWSGRNNYGEDVGWLRDQLRRNWSPHQRMNIYSEIANATDTVWRTGVLVDALKAGRTEAEALTLAREGLFDYGNLTAFEKQYVSRVFWFWTFQRNALRSFGKALLSNPSRLAHLFKVSKGLPEDGRTHIGTKDYAQLRPFLAIVEDSAARQRYALYGPSIPMADALAQLLDYSAMFAPILDPSLTGAQKVREVGEAAIANVAGNANPAWAALLVAGFGVDPRRKGGAKPGTWIDPRYIWWLHETGQWDTFNAIVNVERVPEKERTPGGGTYQGEQWRIQKDDAASRRVWQLMQFALLTAGVDRTMRDYSPMFESLLGGGGADGVDDVRLELADPTHEFWRDVGVLTAIEEPTLQERREANQRDLTYELMYRR